MILAVIAILPIASGIAAKAEGDVQEEKLAELNENIRRLLNDLDLSELQKYLDEHGNSFIANFGDNARGIVEYLINGNAGTDYGSYLNEIGAVLFKNVKELVPAFATVTAVAVLCAVVTAAEGSILGKSTSKVMHLACYSLIILVLSSMLTGIISSCISCINNVKRQIEIITPILATLTVLTGGTGSAAIYSPSAVFLAGGAVEIISGFIFPVTIAVTVLNFMSRLNPQISFGGVSALLKSIMKWAIGITVTVFGIFLTAQSAAASLFDGIIFKAAKYVVGNSVPIVGNFLSGGFDLLTSAGLLIKNSVGLCGIILLLGEIMGPVIVLVAFSVMLKIAGAVVQPVGENSVYGLLSDLSKDVEFFIAGLLTVSFMYALTVMLVINSANSFI